MAARHEDHDRGAPYRSERGDRQKRGVTDHASDEVHSWFGVEEAERRRWMDEAERRRERESERPYRRDYGPYDYGWGSDDRWAPIGNRYPAERGWRYRDIPRYGYGGETGRDTSWSGPSTGTYSQYGSRYTPWYETGSNRQDWERQGPFAGRGPKGYQRSDSRIREDVSDRLTDAADVDASEIEVTVNNGEVTLSGTVRTREEKRRSEDLTDTVTGVREVHNSLHVRGRQEGRAALKRQELGAPRTR